MSLFCLYQEIYGLGGGEVTRACPGIIACDKEFHLGEK